MHGLLGASAFSPWRWTTGCARATLVVASMGHITCGHIARGSQVFRGRETYEKTSPDDLDTLGKKTPALSW
jgi:hypothetical protein